MLGFPDAERVVMEYVDDLGYCVTSTPPDLQERLPVIRVNRAGGNDDDVTDFPRMSIQTFCRADYESPRAALGLMNRIRERVDDSSLPAWVPGERVTIEDSRTESGPVRAPWPDPQVQVVTAAFRLSISRPVKEEEKEPDNG